MNDIQGWSCWSLRFWRLKLSLVSIWSLEGFSNFLCVSALYSSCLLWPVLPANKHVAAWSSLPSTHRLWWYAPGTAFVCLPPATSLCLGLSLFWLCSVPLLFFLLSSSSSSLSFSISPCPSLSLLRHRSMYPMHHVYILLSLFRAAVFPFNKLLPVSKWLVLSPLQSEETGTGCNECEEVFIMNRISLLFTQTLLAAQGAKQTILQLSGIKHKEWVAKGVGGRQGLSDRTEGCWERAD